MTENRESVEGSDRSKRSVGAGVDRRAFLTAAGSSAVAMTAGCLGGGGNGDDGGDSPDTITIGGLFPLPGEFAGGTGMQQATEVLVEKLNADGGLLGAEVDLVTEDTALDPSTARDRYRELLLEEEVDVTTGVYSSEVGTAVFDEIPEFETIHAAGGTANMDPAEQVGSNYEDHKYWFRSLNGRILGLSAVGYVDEYFEELGFTEIGLAVEDIDGFDPIVNAFVENLPEFINVNFDTRFASDTTDFTPILDQGEEDDIDMMCAFISQGGGALMTQWAQRQMNYHFGGGDIFSTNPGRWEATDGLVEYVWTYVGGSGPGFEINEETEQFIQDHQDQFDGNAPPHAQAYSQYDAIRTWAQAVEEAGTLDEDEVIATMEEETFQGVTGTIDYYGQDGQWPHDPRFGEEYLHSPVIQWQEVDGEPAQVGLYPEKVRAGEYQSPPWIS